MTQLPKCLCPESLAARLALNPTVAPSKESLYRSGLKIPECEICGITEWLDKPAPLQLDHADGDDLNNCIENLRILCANCHMQTETWGARNKGRPLAGQIPVQWPSRKVLLISPA
jgi:hypothetical protein